MTWQERLLGHATLALLVGVVLLIAFCLDDAPGFRSRMLSVSDRWASATEDTSSTFAVDGRTVTVTSTREAAVRLLRDTIGEL